MKEDLIDEMTITTIPILLGGGIPLFGELHNPMMFKCVDAEVYPGNIPQMRYERIIP